MPECPLTSVAVERGLAGGPFGSNLVNSDYSATGVPVIRGANMAGRFVGGEFAFVTEKKFNRDLSRNTALPGDLVFTQRGTLGQVAVVPSEPYDIYVLSQSQMRLRVDPAKADPRFVFYACRSGGFLKQIANRAVATGVPHINLGILGQLTIPNLAVKQQRAIAEVLGAIDDKIAANAVAIAKADEFAAATTARAMDGTVRSLVELADLTMGSSPPGESYNEVGDGLPFHQGVRDFGVRYPGQRVWTTAPVRLAEPRDTLISVRAPVGRVNIAIEEMCLGRGLAGARSRADTPWTLFHQIRAAQDEWAPFEAVGTVFGAINKAQLEAVSIPCLGAGVETDIEVRLAALEGDIHSKLRESERLAATRDELLPLLMSGRLTIPDVETVT